MNNIVEMPRRWFTKQELQDAYDVGSFSTLDIIYALQSQDIHSNLRSFDQWYAHRFERKRLDIQQIPKIVLKLTSGLSIVLDAKGCIIPALVARTEVVERYLRELIADEFRVIYINLNE